MPGPKYLSFLLHRTIIYVYNNIVLTFIFLKYTKIQLENEHNRQSAG